MRALVLAVLAGCGGSAVVLDEPDTFEAVESGSVRLDCDGVREVEWQIPDRSVFTVLLCRGQSECESVDYVTDGGWLVASCPSDQASVRVRYLTPVTYAWKQRGG